MPITCPCRAAAVEIGPRRPLLHRAGEASDSARSGRIIARRRGTPLSSLLIRGFVLGIRTERPCRNDEHPTAKPVALIAEHLRNSTVAGELGLEPFAGSGSTLVAAERLGRRCAALELDPRYADVVVERWQRLTGAVARLEDDRRSFAEVREARHGR
jgi:DNA modification methylase